jgi:hypothetical protein
MTQKVRYTVVSSAVGGLYLVKTITETDESDKPIVISSSRAQLLLTDGENLPWNIALSFQFVVSGSTLLVSSPSPKKGFRRFWAWEISDPSSLEPISSKDILFLNEFGQIVKNNLPFCNGEEIRMTQKHGLVLLHAPRTSILVGGIAKTETKSFSLQFNTEVNKMGKKTLRNFRINLFKEKKVVE